MGHNTSFYSSGTRAAIRWSHYSEPVFCAPAPNKAILALLAVQVRLASHTVILAGSHQPSCCIVLWVSVTDSSKCCSGLAERLVVNTQWYKNTQKRA